MAIICFVCGWVNVENFVHFSKKVPNSTLSMCNFKKKKNVEKSACKVEFIQPSNWFYSVPNLLVIQHLVTLYLGGFDVRVVSEIE